MSEFKYTAEPISYPSSIPEGYNYIKEEVEFDPNVHLELSDPSYLTDLNFNKKKFPLSNGDTLELSFSYPFRILSDKGVSVFREIMKRESSNESIKQVINEEIHLIYYSLIIELHFV